MSARPAARRCLPVGLCIAAALGAAGLSGEIRADPSTPRIDVVLGGTRVTHAVEQLVASAQLRPEEDVRVRELGRDQDTSHHLVILRNREPLHRHDRHALTVLVLRGDGAMSIDGEERLVGAGSLIHVPRGSVHAFINQSPEPAVAYVIYAPPFDGTDRQLAARPTP